MNPLHCRKKDRLLKKMRKEIARITNTMEAVKLLPDDLPDQATINAIPNCLFIHIPFDWSLFRSVRKALDSSEETTWIPRSTWQDPHDGQHIFCYDWAHNDNIRMQIQLNPLDEGAKCELVQVGTEERPIYSTVCK